MKALVWTQPEEMKWREVPEPICEAYEAVIQVEAVGICGSEIEGFLGHNSLRMPPLIMGHEFCGVVRVLGSHVRDLTVGQRVVVNPLLSCEVCVSCRRGLPQLCRERRIIGIHRSGAFGEYVAVPRSAIIPIDSDINPYRAALAEPLACSLRAAKRAMAQKPLANVLVFGAGGIGLLSSFSAKILGALKVIMADTNPSRLEIARKNGIDVVVNPKEADLSEVIRHACPDGIDVVVDAAGFQPTREAAVRLLNPGGVFMNIGLGIDETQLPVNYIIRNEIQVLGSFCYSKQDFQDALQLLRYGRVTEVGWTEIRPLSEGFEAFRDLIGGKVHHGKIILSVSSI